MPVRPDQIIAAATTVLNKQTSAVPASAISGLVSLSRAMAHNASADSLGQIHAVLTTRQQANALASQATVNSDQAVYLVQLQGQFTALQASVPYGHQLPVGHYLTFTVDADTGAVLDWGVSENSSNLAALGPVASLPQ